MSEAKLYKGDCLELLANIPDSSVDLIVTDPPYQIDNTTVGGKNKWAQSIQLMNTEIANANLCQGFDLRILDEMVRVMKKINIYIWCNHKQIPMYLDYFVKQLGCAFDILVWVKQNAMPLFNNKYLTDKEYCLYFRKGGYCNPKNYEEAKTAYFQLINHKDKKAYGHPTIKPLNIITNLIKNSSKEGDVVLDCFMGSGTTGVACAKLGREFIGMEINEEYFKIAEQRIRAENQPTLF